MVKQYKSKIVRRKGNAAKKVIKKVTKLVKVARPRNYFNQTGFSLPPTKIWKMRYVTTFTMTGTSGAMATYKFRANSIYAPNGEVSSHQPYQHDESGIFYNKYIVLGSKARLYQNSSSTSQSYPYMFGIQLNSHANTVTTDWQQMVEQGHEKFAVRNLNWDGKRVATRGFSLKKTFGLSSVKDNWDLYGSHYGANPTELAYFTCWMQSQDRTTTASNEFFIIIDYIVMTGEPKNLAQS